MEGDIFKNNAIEMIIALHSLITHIFKDKHNILFIFICIHLFIWTYKSVAFVKLSSTTLWRTQITRSITLCPVWSYSFVTKKKCVPFVNISDAMFLNVLHQIHKGSTSLRFKYSFGCDYNMSFPIWHSGDRASWCILIMKANDMHYFSNLFDKVLYMFRTCSLSIIRNISTLYTRNRYLSC
jgi:hypothetical protein